MKNRFKSITYKHPLAEASRRWTPYNYAYNNPVYYIDPDGMESNSNSGSGGQNLSNDDFDVMVDMGYGRKMSASKIAGAVGFSGASVQLSKSGETKFAEAALKDALNGILNNDEHSIGDKNSQPKVQSKREKLKENINVTKDIGDRAEVVKALDEYIAELTNGNPNKVLGKFGKVGGIISSGGSIAISGLEYTNNEISGLELTFDIGTTLTSIWVGSKVGATFGGPQGFVAGTAVTTVSELIVKPLYKKYFYPKVVKPAENSYNREV